ncbi:MAG: hypothetical protein ABIJ92_02705, partial [Candidatus Aenigmatarchaeota archaeon]
VKTTTDSNGLTSWIWLKEYNQTGNGTYVTGCTGSTGRINCTTPHNVTTTFSTSYNSTNFTVNVSQTQTINLGSCSIAVGISETLSTGVNFSVVTIPGNDLEADGNDNGSSVTMYNISVAEATGCTVDLYIKANADLWSGVDVIGLANETYCNSTTDNTVPGTACRYLNTSYAGNKIGDALGTGSNVFLKFYLDIPSGQAAGTYNNSLNIHALSSGSSPDDAIPTLVDFVSPTPAKDATDGPTPPIVNVTYSEDNFNFCVLQWYNVTGAPGGQNFTNSTEVSSSCLFNDIGSQSSGDINTTVFVYDTQNNINQTINRNWSISGQTCGNGAVEGTEVCDTDFTNACPNPSWYQGNYVEDGVTCIGKSNCKNDCTACNLFCPI